MRRSTWPTLTLSPAFTRIPRPWPPLRERAVQKEPSPFRIQGELDPPTPFHPRPRRTLTTSAAVMLSETSGSLTSMSIFLLNPLDLFPDSVLSPRYLQLPTGSGFSGSISSSSAARLMSSASIFPWRKRRGEGREGDCVSVHLKELPERRAAVAPAETVGPQRREGARQPVGEARHGLEVVPGGHEDAPTPFRISVT